MKKISAPSTAKLGPGEYRPDIAFTRPEDLPPPKLIKQRRISESLPCPRCRRPAPRDKVFTRQVHDVGDLWSGRPHELHITYSQHYCSACRKYFSADLSGVAPPQGHYTHRVMALAVRLVVEDGLPYRSASWALWRDHRVFVPFATIQNWVEAGGKKGQ
jgi:transposase